MNRQNRSTLVEERSEEMYIARYVIDFSLSERSFRNVPQASDNTAASEPTNNLLANDVFRKCRPDC
jgi:hypothetical protein